jgi:hypothetical protein
MEENTQITPQTDWVDRFGRWLCFMVMATAGMGGIGVAILAEPLAVFYADEAAVRAHQKRLEDLKQLNGQLGELLQNAGQPAVIERAAINNLRYIPEDAVSSKTDPLPRMSPALEKALKKIGRPPKVESDSTQQFFETLAAHSTEQTMLLILGSGLVVVSMTFFNRPG